MSAGALRSVEVIIVDWRGRSRAFRYNALRHQLESLQVVDRPAFETFAETCTRILPLARGTAIVLAGDEVRLGSLYENPRSLLWRESGALLQTMSLCAQSHRLAFCPLGTLGGDLITAIGQDSARCIPLGGALLGRFHAESDI